MTTEVEQIHALPAKARDFGGWLLLVGFGVLLAPFKVGYALLTNFFSVFLSPSWSEMTNPELNSYVPFYASFAIFEGLLNIVFLIVSLTLAHLFLQKKSMFPKLFATTSWLFLMVALLYVVAETAFFPPPTSEGDVGVLAWLVRCLIWTPYLLISKRSKETFIM